MVNEGIVMKKAAYLLNIVGKHPVLLRKRNKAAHKMMGFFQHRATSQRAPELNCLAGTKQLDSQDMFQIVEHLVELAATDASHTHMIFLPQGSWNTVGARRKTKAFVFGH